MYAIRSYYVVYIAHWIIAPGLNARLSQPYLIIYLICWGTTEVCFLGAALVAYKAEGNLLQWKSSYNFV